jgi:flagellar hook assembly protein FlgD
MRIFDLSGRSIRTLIHGEMRNAGQQTPAFWDGRDDNGRQVSAGVYTVRLTVDAVHIQRHFALIH